MPSRAREGVRRHSYYLPMHIPRPSSGPHGLSMLLGGSHNSEGRLVNIPIAQIVRNEAQPRTHFDPDAIASLASSITANGIIQPIAVRELPNGTFEIVAGERRWLASRQAGRATIPAVVHDVDERESMVLALAENLVRENLNPLETARAYAALLDEFNMNVAELARAVGKSRPAVANTLRLLELPDDVLAAIEERRLTEGHGRALLGLPDRPSQCRLARHAIEHSLSVRGLEAKVRETLSPDKTPAKSTHSTWNREPSPELEAQLEQLTEGLIGVRAKVKLGDRAGKLELQCSDPQILFDLVDRLTLALAAN